MAILNPTKLPSVGEYFGYLHYIQKCAHLTHLYQSVETLAFHNVMSELYEGMEDLADSFIEAYQGKYQKVLYSVPECSPFKSALDSVQTCMTYIENSRVIFKDSFLQNMIDEQLSLLSGVLFKLKYVK